jgi:hypothetical protein
VPSFLSHTCEFRQRQEVSVSDEDVPLAAELDDVYGYLAGARETD